MACTKSIRGGIWYWRRGGAHDARECSDPWPDWTQVEGPAAVSVLLKLKPEWIKRFWRVTSAEFNELSQWQGGSDAYFTQSTLSQGLLKMNRMHFKALPNDTGSLNLQGSACLKIFRANCNLQVIFLNNVVKIWKAKLHFFESSF